MTLDRTTELFAALSDASRLRMLAALSRHELSVAELVDSLGLVQSRVSTHLARLKDTGLLKAVKDGAATRWALDPSGLDGAGQRTWAVVKDELGAAHFAKDAERVAAVVARRAAPKSWPETVAGEMEKHYSPGRTWESMAHALSALLNLGDVLDVGAGDGTVAALLAPHARSYTCLEQSERLVTAARARLRGLAGVRVEAGDAAALPFADASFDEVLLLNVLPCLAEPQAVIREAARVLRPGGRLLTVTLDRHDHLDLVARYGHVAPGIAPKKLAQWLTAAGLTPHQAAVTSHERREPRFGVITALAQKLASAAPSAHKGAARAASPPRTQAPETTKARATGASRRSEKR